MAAEKVAANILVVRTAGASLPDELDVGRVKRLLESRGLTFFDCKRMPFREFKAMQVANDVVYYLSVAQAEMWYSTPMSTDSDEGVLCGFLAQMCRNAFLRVDLTLTTQKLNLFLASATEWECVVCFEERDLSMNLTFKSELFACSCGKVVCIGCFIDLMVDSTNRMDILCPNCRTLHSSLGNWSMILNVLSRQPALDGMSDTQRAFVKHWTGFDGTQTAAFRRKQSATFTRLYKMTITRNFVRKYSADKTENATTRTECDDVFDEVKALFLGGKSQPMAGASAGVYAVANCSNRGCGNCGKQFWDKREWKRAPKCKFCKTTAYCNAKCRKKHLRTHASVCSARKSKKKKKKKKAPPKKANGCSAS